MAELLMQKKKIISWAGNSRIWSHTWFVLFILFLGVHYLDIILFVGTENPHTKLGSAWPCLLMTVLDGLFSILGIN